MKKMYKKPMTKDVEMVASSVICTSLGMGSQVSGTDADHREFGNAPGRHRNTLIVK